jgi:hypothetical protein
MGSEQEGDRFANAFAASSYKNIFTFNIHTSPENHEFFCFLPLFTATFEGEPI